MILFFGIKDEKFFHLMVLNENNSQLKVPMIVCFPISLRKFHFSTYLITYSWSLFPHIEGCISIDSDVWGGIEKEQVISNK